MARKNDILSIYTKEVEQIKADGLFKGEAPFVSPQGAKVVMEDGRELLNMCANNYLGLGDNQRLIDAAKRTYDENGYENEYILLYLEDRSYFYIGKLDWKHDFYALYL